MFFTGHRSLLLFLIAIWRFTSSDQIKFHGNSVSYRQRVAKLKAAYDQQQTSSRQIQPETPINNQTNNEENLQPQDQAKRWGLQGRVLLQRSWKQIKRDKATTVARIMSNVSSAIIFGSIYWRTGLQQSSIQNRMGLLQVSQTDSIIWISSITIYNSCCCEVRVCNFTSCKFYQICHGSKCEAVTGTLTSSLLKRCNLLPIHMVPIT